MSSVDIRHEGMRIGGEVVFADKVVEVRYPYTNEVIGTVPAGTAEHAAKAFEIAAAYQAKLTRYERSQILTRAGELIGEKREYLAKWLTLELGICHQHAIYETKRAQDVYQFAAMQSMNDDGEIFSCDLTHNGKARKIYTKREPVRAISAITPFNHPLNMVSHKIAPSIATNNRMVCKPTELTPLTALLLADVLYEAGLPPEMFNVVTGMPSKIGDSMITDPNIDLITFTGGVPVGKMIADKAGYKRCVLELGGNAPFIVMEDADIERAATMAVAGATKNSGQRCTAVKRILVQESIADAFAKACVEKAKKLKAGNPTDPDTDIGTVITEKAAMTFQRRVVDAVAAGATLLYGNDRVGAVFPPTVVDHVRPEMELVTEETFGPAIPIMRFKDIDDAISIANGTNFGLSSGVATNRFDYITRFINELQHGTVNIWEVPGYRIEMSPFGGIKDSGLGYKEGVIEAMKSFTNVKTFSMPWQ